MLIAWIAASRDPMVFIDSNVWIGYFNINDRHHEKARVLIHKVKEETERPVIYITSGILHEVINHLFKIKGREMARHTLEAMLSIPNLNILFLTDRLWERTLGYFESYELGLTDAQIAAAMEEIDDPVIYSFDRHFDQLPWIRRIEQ